MESKSFLILEAMLVLFATLTFHACFYSQPDYLSASG